VLLTSPDLGTYMSGVDLPHTSLRFLERSAEVDPHRPAVVEGDRR
jgi:hypothetical protein